MRFSMVMCKPPAQPLLDAAGLVRRSNMDFLIPWRQKEKVVVILGATGTGKSRLSIDIASRFPAEIVNSDKIQVHKGLDVLTNKITDEEQCGIPHHLLGTIPPDADFTASDFCDSALLAIESIRARGNTPVIVGGSNSYIEALITSHDYGFRSKYECCFLWVDMAMPVLHSFVSKRVDKMVERGMIEEARNFFDPNADYSRGIRRAIGVPELDLFFRNEKSLDRQARARLLEEGIEEIKNNTRKLACRQLEKIDRLRNLKGWNLHRMDVTEVFRKHGKAEADEAWEELVAGPSTLIVAEFLYSVTANMTASGGLHKAFEALKNGVPTMEAAIAAANYL
ncbi:adenylate isopentenyltransferase 3, chloroplastic [Syzygium oleosum]|uniref:adenylate isopentenyltransferase 3, chloroplastic n=1 Tax=Syzygium oleosum TaxID=219896 RepID=UPI0011D2796C|nr:adenylate isopentenyltransferase 3, chloroplastic [Syzygium oleosum]